MNCPKCEGENEDKALQCFYCGEVLCKQSDKSGEIVSHKVKEKYNIFLISLILISIGISFFLYREWWPLLFTFWPLFITFLGLAFIIDAILRLLTQKPILVGRSIALVILLAIGLSFIFYFYLKNLWMIILIVIGIYLLIMKILFK